MAGLSTDVVCSGIFVLFAACMYVEIHVLRVSGVQYFYLFLLTSQFTKMEKFLSVCEREASLLVVIIKYPRSRNCDDSFMSFGFTCVFVTREERSQCVFFLSRNAVR